MISWFAGAASEATERTRLEALAASATFARAAQYLDATAEETTRELITLNEIPAPPFKEAARAAYVLKRFTEIGLRRAHIDAEGNALGVWPGTTDVEGRGPFVAFAAHMDSVFPEGTDVTVRHDGRRLRAPGIGDNGCGLSGMLALARCLTQMRPPLTRSTLFVGTVGEEGAGNLRGVRHLFESNELGQCIQEFVALDGPGVERITHQGVGSRRYDVRFLGPGGHSWANFGVVNPAQAVGRFISHLSEYRAPESPRTTYAVTILEGGVSVNAIPRLARCEVDLRSVSATELDRVERFMRAAAERAQYEETARASGAGRLELEVIATGARPSGETPADARLVRLAKEATRACGRHAILDCSSTDANVPMSRGVPAITLGAGGVCAGCHTLDEWYEPTNREISLKRTVLLLFALAELAV
jgi:acetylornithine deacetylase/succinyl-diaminopimelate desuccinylase-like protein